MNPAPTLFDDPPAPALDPLLRFARRSDPDTSKAAGAAAEEFEGPMGRLVLATIVELERHSTAGATAAEVVMRLAYTGQAPQQNSVSRRLTTLKRKGYVRDTGERRPSAYRGGHQLIVFSATREGRAYLTEET